ncbi:hypothetical protein [Methylophilus sp. DW102]|uniref:hypothetical protein n=1 Tax=Methylophilus sp. DW102 TaxID=3095607 RepID=UPI00308E34FD|nr:hypothetical protein MTDW_02340 [Methylophilus sp. DW102]
MAELDITRVDDLIVMAQSVDASGMGEVFKKCETETEESILGWVNRLWSADPLAASIDDLVVNASEFIQGLSWGLSARESELLSWLDTITETV